MLKIKNHVDLKDLEKFGFEYDEEIKHYEINFSYNPDGFMGLSISERSRVIFFYTSVYDYETQDKLYDLIKADLVEKVGE